jgi:putative Mg2+ transporter-C (MgtC) family protein
VTQREFAVRLAVAFALGTAIGIERQFRQRMAGLRTNALVATGACLFVLASGLSRDASSPTRVAAQIVSGIGFLAGGVIFREGLSVRGLNTAATLWCSAAIGTLAGFGDLVETAIGSAFVLAANVALRPISQAINRRTTEGTEVSISYAISVTCPSAYEAALRARLFDAIAANGLSLHEIASEDAGDDEREIDVEATVISAGRRDATLEHLVATLALEPYVTAASWRVIALDEEAFLATASAE